MIKVSLLARLYLCTCLVVHGCVVGGVTFAVDDTRYILTAKFATVEGILSVSQKLVDEGYVIYPSTDGWRYFNIIQPSSLVCIITEPEVLANT